MLLGRVIGTVWATRKEEKIEGLKLQVVRAIDPQGNPLEDFVVAADAVGAGVGEVVLVAQGSSGRMTRETWEKPCDAVIMAIVENLEVQEAEQLVAEYGSRKKALSGRFEALEES